jgi:DNA-binding NtrC family response regulator
MAQQRASVLVVDDDLDTCKNLSDILTDLGYQVDTANDGRRALELVRQNAYDVALLDLKMPGMDGLTLYREIRKLRAGTVAIVVTAYATGETARTALQAGAWRIVPKPVDFEALLQCVEDAIGQPLVMVVDDDRELCDTLWNLLRERDFRVCIAHDAERAAELLKDRAYRVVVIDVKLPEQDGRQLLRLVRDMNPAARTVLITGFRAETEQLVQRALGEGADAVCYKPFDVPEFLSTLERLAH